MDEEGQCYLYVDCIVILVDGVTEYGSACEYEFDHNEGDKIENPPKVVVEEEQFGVV